MLYRLTGTHWVHQAQGWIILKLTGKFFLYPTGQIVYLPSYDQRFLEQL